MSKLIILTLSLILFTGCFHYEEEMFLKKDGSGEVTIRFVFGKFISSMMDLDENNDVERGLKMRLKRDKGLEIIDENIFLRKGNRVYEVTVRFDNYKNLRYLDLETDNIDNDMGMDVREFFENIDFDGKNYTRRLDMDNNNHDDDEVPSFLAKMIDVEFHFSVEIEGQKGKEWAFDINDLANKGELVMEVR